MSLHIQKKKTNNILFYNVLVHVTCRQGSHIISSMRTVFVGEIYQSIENRALFPIRYPFGLISNNSYDWPISPGQFARLLLVLIVGSTIRSEYQSYTTNVIIDKLGNTNFFYRIRTIPLNNSNCCIY